MLYDGFNFKVMGIYDTEYAVGRPYCNIATVNKGTKYEYRQGKYVCNDGVVTIYEEPKLTNFEFVKNGRIYSRTITEKQKPFTDRQLSMKAKKFLNEIISSY